MDFNQLSEIIGKTHKYLQSSSIKAINQNLTVRNWLIGYYIVEFEQNGEDRAVYGARLLKTLEKRIDDKGLNETLFYWSRKFYISYPFVGKMISATVSQKLVVRTKDSALQSSQSPFAFEFLGLKSFEIIEEKDLEQALIDHLQEWTTNFLYHNICCNFQTRKNWKNLYSKKKI